MSDESDIKNIEKENLSTSILEMPSFIKNYKEPETNTNCIDSEPNNQNEENDKNPFSIDPVFIQCKFQIPKILYNLAKKTPACSFHYCLSPDNTLKIESDSSTRSYNVYEYGTKFAFTSDNIFLYNKKKYVRKFHTKENKEFKKSIEEKGKYAQSDELSEYKEFIYSNQIKYRCNIYYVESYDDLLSIFKALVCDKKEIKIKTRKFGSEMKREQLEYILSSVPGVSKNVAKSMCLRFTSLADFVTGLYEIDEKHFIDLPVILDDGVSSRILGQKQYELFKRVFLGTDPCKRVTE